MSSSRKYHSILLSLKIASVVMPSLTTACRIPAPVHVSQPASVARVPIATARSIPRPVNSPSVARRYTPTVQRIATARSIPRPVNSPSVARRYTPTVQRTSPSTTIASMASSFAAMSISKPVSQAIAPSSAPKPTSPLPCVAALCSKLASDRIQARRQRVTANLNVAKKRPTAPVSIPQSSSMPSRAVPPAAIAPASIRQASSMSSRAVPPVAIAPVSILRNRSKPSRVIPLPRIHARMSSTLVSSWMPPRGREPRGTEPYCEGRPGETDDDGNRLRGDYQPLNNFGIRCTCHPEDKDWIGPRRWKTTPAEADVSVLSRETPLPHPPYSMVEFLLL